MLADDLRLTINSGHKDAVKISLEVKVRLMLIRLCTSVWITDVQDTLLQSKRMVQDANSGSQTINVFLSEDGTEESCPL